MADRATWHSLPLQIAVLLVASLGGAGCGSGDSDPGTEAEAAEVIRGYLVAVAEGDGETACSYLTENAQLGVFEFRFAHVGPDHPARACASVVKRGAPRDETMLRRTRVGEVQIDGDTASAKVAGMDASLKWVEDVWRIDVFGLAGRVAGETVPPEPTLK